MAAAGIAEFIHNESRHLQASAVTTFWRAQEHMARREWGIAEQYPRQIIADGEPWGAPYIELGNLYGQRQRWREAAHFYRRGLKLEPDFWLASDALGAALTEIQDWAGAIDAYRHALDVCPWWPYEEAL